MNELYQACGAELVLLGTVLVLILAEIFWPRRGALLKGLAAAAGVAAGFAVLPYLGGPAPAFFAGKWAMDPLSVTFKVIILIAAAIAVLLSIEEVRSKSRAGGEYFILLLLAAVGMMIMASGRDILVMYLGVELMAISFYVLTGFYWFRESSAEAAIKYVLTGLFASALLMYGIAFLYGASGTTDLVQMGRVLGPGGRFDLLVLAGLALTICGLAFKMGAAPFHMWMPDVLDGAPTPVSGFLAVGPKIAVLAVAMRLLLSGFQPWQETWGPLIWSLSALTILWGNLAGIAQSQLKRMLAYSSIAHVGYLLIAVAAAGREQGDAVASVTFYLVVYVFMNLGAFGVLIWFENAVGEDLTWRDLAGMARRAPYMAVLLSLFMFSLAGIPPTAGFIGKLWIFMSAWKAGYTGLVLVGVAGSLIGAFYYLRVVYALYMLPDEDGAGLGLDFSALLYAVTLSAAGVVLAGFAPEFFMRLARATGF